MCRIRNTWTLGVVQAVKVLCDFGPSLFGYNGAIGLHAHLDFIITNEQNNDKVIACQLLQVAMATSHGM